MLIIKLKYLYLILMDDLLNRYGIYHSLRWSEIWYSYPCLLLIFVKSFGYPEFLYSIFINKELLICRHWRLKILKHIKNNCLQWENINKNYKCESTAHTISPTAQQNCPKNNKKISSNLYSNLYSQKNRKPQHP